MGLKIKYYMRLHIPTTTRHAQSLRLEETISSLLYGFTDGQKAINEEWAEPVRISTHMLVH